MDYLTYLTTYPHWYQTFSLLLERTPNLCRYIREQGLFKPRDRFFSIGAGEGALELALAKEYQSEFELLEPAKLLVDSFNQSVLQMDASNFVSAVHHQSFEEYKVVQQFDRVLAIHSWYGFGYDVNILQKALSMVKPGGILLINIMSQKSPVYGLSNMSYSRGIELCAENLSRWALEQGFEHSLEWEVARRPAALFFDKQDHLTTDAKYFSCFLLAKEWDQLSAKEHQQVYDILQDHRRGDTVDIVSGCLVFRKAHAP